jgi:hypothetical protein
VKGCHPPAPSEADGGLMVMLTGFSVTDALADLVESSCETALTVTTICVAIEAGAVYQAEPEPPSTIVPIVLSPVRLSFTYHVTAGLLALCTVAVKL